MATKFINAVAFAAALAAAVSLAGCTTATPYQPDVAGQRVTGGYSEEATGEGRYNVTFSGNNLTSRDRVEGYLLYRAAELTLRDGYDWFVIVDRLTERDVRTYVHPDPLYDPWYGPGYGYWRPHWRYRHAGDWLTWHPEWGTPFWGDRLDVRTVESFEAHAQIVMRRGAIPAGEERAFDARRVISDLGPSVERPERQQN
jgi:hypothetical protein